MLKTTKTERGFDISNFIDSNGVACSLQKSSAAQDDFVWLGCDGPNPQIFVPNGNPSWREYPLPAEVLCTTRMHLSREQVSALLPSLQRFVETGEL